MKQFKIMQFKGTQSSFRMSVFTKILILLIMSTFSMSAQVDESKKKNKCIKPGKRQAVLILSNGEQVKLNQNDSLNYSQTKQHTENISKKKNTKVQENNTEQTNTFTNDKDSKVRQTQITTNQP